MFMKSLVESKTFWLAAAQALTGILVVFATAYPDAGYLLVAKSIVDIVLRLATTTTINTVFPSTE